MLHLVVYEEKLFSDELLQEMSFEFWILCFISVQLMTSNRIHTGGIGFLCISYRHLSITDVSIIHNELISLPFMHKEKEKLPKSLYS